MPDNGPYDYIRTGFRWHTADDYQTILFTLHYRPATVEQIAAGAKVIPSAR